MKKNEKITQIVDSNNENVLEILNEALKDLESLNEESALKEIQNNCFVIENDFYNGEINEQNFSYLYDESLDDDVEDDDWIDEEIDYLENKYLISNKNKNKILIH